MIFLIRRVSDYFVVYNEKFSQFILIILICIFEVVNAYIEVSDFCSVELQDFSKKGTFFKSRKKRISFVNVNNENFISSERIFFVNKGTIFEVIAIEF